MLVRISCETVNLIHVILKMLPHGHIERVIVTILKFAYAHKKGQQIEVTQQDNQPSMTVEFDKFRLNFQQANRPRQKSRTRAPNWSTKSSAQAQFSLRGAIFNVVTDIISLSAQNKTVLTSYSRIGNSVDQADAADQWIPGGVFS